MPELHPFEEGMRLLSRRSADRDGTWTTGFCEFWRPIRPVLDRLCVVADRES